MPILAHTATTDRALIKNAFLPFACPEYITGMLIGDDLDSLLSAMYLHRLFGWPVVAVYCRYTQLWYNGSAKDFMPLLHSGRLMAVDLDIYHDAVPSLGHHIIAWNNADALPGHSHTLNPNSLFGRSVTQGYKQKYPLATIHLLRWLWETAPEQPGAEWLTWLADSAFINAQRYEANVMEWVQQYLSLPAFQKVLTALQTRDFEKNMQHHVLAPLSGNVLARQKRSSSYQSRHLGINGFQCQFEHPVHQNAHIQHLLDTLAHISGWPRLPFPTSFEHAISGHRREIILTTKIDLDDWLEQNDVFSYAFTFRNRLNYTVL